MKSIVALICLCFVQQTVEADETCLAKAALSENCDTVPDDKCAADIAVCSTFTASADCTAKSCIWTAGSVCTDGCTGESEDVCDAACDVDGICQACGDLTTSATCGLAAGCNWNDPTCEDACPSASEAQTTCTADNYCEWDSTECKAKSSDYCADLAAGVGEACEMDAGCESDGGVCKARDCSLHNDITASGPCDTDPGCKIDDTCKSKDCAEYSVDTECKAKGSCMWNAAATPAACVNKDCDNVACSDDADCDWSGSACALKADVCSETDKATCDPISRCSWKFNMCKQPDGECSDNNQADCTTAGECTWNTDGACSANAECDGLDTSDECCANGCAWVECDEISGGGMVNIAVPTLMLSLVSVKLLL